MREISGRKGRVSKGLKALFAALLAFFAIGMFTTSQASAAQQLELEFNDSWIGLPALAGLGAGAFHAIDPTDENAPTMKLKGDLAPNGDFTAPASAFSFPTQVIDAGAPIGEINLDIVSRQDITGSYNADTGAFNANISLRLEIVASALSLNCQLEPLNIPLATTGTYDFGDDEASNSKSGAAFNNGTGAVIGSWTNVTVDNVSENPPNPDPNADVCKALIGGIIENATPEGETPSFDGTIWLGGTATVTGTNDCPDGKVGTFPDCKDPVCPTGKIGTYPDCKDPVAKIGSVKVTKATIKAGKKGKIKVTVKNIGNAAFKGKVTLKSNKKTVKVPKSVQVNIAPGKSVTKTIKVTTTKKAKGKATITAKVGGKTGKNTVTVKAAKKKKK